MKTEPAISIVIPVKDQAAMLSDCLRSLSAADPPDGSVEIIVVDNGSSDSSAHVAEDAGVRVLFEPRPGPYAARNTGAHAALSPIIAFTDADCRVDNAWMTEILIAMREFDAICGMSHGMEGGSVAGLIQERYERNLLDRSRAEPIMPIFDTRNAAVRRDAFLAVGGFDTRMEDLSDDLFGIQVHLRGGRVGFRKSVIVHHIHPESLTDVIRRQVRHGRYMPVLRRNYDTRVLSYFPGIGRFRVVDQNGFVGIVASAGITVTAASVVFAMRMILAGFGRFGSRLLVTQLFDLFCRAGTVMGIGLFGLGRGLSKR